MNRFTFQSMCTSEYCRKQQSIRPNKVFGREWGYMLQAMLHQLLHPSKRGFGFLVISTTKFAWISAVCDAKVRLDITLICEHRYNKVRFDLTARIFNLL